MKKVIFIIFVILAIFTNTSANEYDDAFGEFAETMKTEVPFKIDNETLCIAIEAFPSEKKFFYTLKLINSDYDQFAETFTAKIFLKVYKSKIVTTFKNDKNLRFALFRGWVFSYTVFTSKHNLVGEVSISLKDILNNERNRS